MVSSSSESAGSPEFVGFSRSSSTLGSLLSRRRSRVRVPSLPLARPHLRCGDGDTCAARRFPLQNATRTSWGGWLANGDTAQRSSTRFASRSTARGPTGWTSSVANTASMHGRPPECRKRSPPSLTQSTGGGEQRPPYVLRRRRSQLEPSFGPPAAPSLERARSGTKAGVPRSKRDETRGRLRRIRLGRKSGCRPGERSRERSRLAQCRAAGLRPPSRSPIHAAWATPFPPLRVK